RDWSRARVVDAHRRAPRRPHLGRQRARPRQHVYVLAARGVGIVTSAQVLVVEDNDKNMKLFRDVLQASGYRPLEATTGQRAIELAVEHAQNLVLMDIQLPDIDGAVALGRLRSDERTAPIPVVALAAHAMHGHRERYINAGLN